MKECIITKEKHPDIYDWLSENVYDYKKNERKQQGFTLTDDKKINAYANVTLSVKITEIKYPFGYVSGDFDCSNCNNLKSLIGSPNIVGRHFDYSVCESLTSLIGFPKKVGGDVYLANKNFSNVPEYKERYEFYIDMWLELLDSVSEDDKWEYIDNYKKRVDLYYIKPLIPKEVINKYKVDFLLKELNYGR